MIKNVKYLLLGVLGLAVIGCGKEEAKEVVSWPPATINFICTHGAGGDTDYNTRLIARKLEAKLGVPVVVTNVTGGNGSIAMTQYKDADMTLLNLLQYLEDNLENVLLLMQNLL